MKVSTRLLLGGLFASCVSGQTSSATGVEIGSVNPARVAMESVRASVLVIGVVKTDDGSELPGSVSIQVVCSGSERTVTHTGVTAEFEFQWNPAPMAYSVIASSGYDARSNANGDAATASGGIAGIQSVDCELRAYSGGYTSSVLNLTRSMAMDGSDVGVLWLHRILGNASNLVSVSTLRAPKGAKKDFDKGAELVRADKLPEGAEYFEKAVSIYPEYAEAWLGLGGAQFRMGLNDAARVSIQKALDLDPKLPGAWQTLGYMASDQQDWLDAARYLDQAERLDPASSPCPGFSAR